MSPSASCPNCRRPIVWARSEKKNKRMPVDLERTAGGNILLIHRDLYPGEPIAHVLTKVELAEKRVEHAYNVARGIVDEPELKMHVHHATTCPKASEWSKRGTARRARAAA